MRRPTPFILIFCCWPLPPVAVVWQRAAHGNGGVSAPEGVVYLVLRPVQRTLSIVGDWFSI
jgi:hypothetical protein